MLFFRIFTNTSVVKKKKKQGFVLAFMLVGGFRLFL